MPGTSLARVTEPGALPVVPVEPGSPLMERWLRTNFTVFLQPLLDAEGLAHRQTIMPRDHRYLATLDGEQVVATYRAWDTHVTAPGGAKVAADAVSGVTVLPTHRRRGLLTRMIVPDLADAAERGLAVAILIAAEAPIYGRFGFGPATETAHWRVDVPTARLRPEVHVEGTVTVIGQAELRDVAPAVFEAARRAGALDISDLRWDRELGHNAEGPERTCLVHRDAAGTPQGFAAFRGEERWSDRRIESVAHLERFQAATPQAYTALWSVLTSLDLMATVDADEHAVDEPLPTLLVDPRAARQVLPLRLPVVAPARSGGCVVGPHLREPPVRSRSRSSTRPAGRRAPSPSRRTPPVPAPAGAAAAAPRSRCRSTCSRHCGSAAATCTPPPSRAAPTSTLPGRSPGWPVCSAPPGPRGRPPGSDRPVAGAAAGGGRPDRGRPSGSTPRMPTGCACTLTAWSR